jgi:hypothetical protein
MNTMTDDEYRLHRKEIQRKYREKNKDRIRERNREWSKKNREKISKRQKYNRQQERIENGLSKYQKPLTVNSPFVRVYTTVKNSKKHECFLTVDDIREQFERQNGLCALSGLSLLTPKSSGDKKEKHPMNLSVDRIDSSLPYQKGNIQLVCLALNYAKNTWTNDQIKNFICQLQSRSSSPLPSPGHP